MRSGSLAGSSALALLERDVLALGGGGELGAEALHARAQLLVGGPEDPHGQQPGIARAAIDTVATGTRRASARSTAASRHLEVGQGNRYADHGSGVAARACRQMRGAAAPAMITAGRARRRCGRTRASPQACGAPRRRGPRGGRRTRRAPRPPLHHVEVGVAAHHHADEGSAIVASRRRGLGARSGAVVASGNQDRPPTSSACARRAVACAPAASEPSAVTCPSLRPARARLP